MKSPAVFLDRDGVLNSVLLVDGRPLAPASIEDFHIPPGTAEALERLRQAGYALVVVTNQPDVARGRTTREAVEAMHAALMAALPLDEIRVCYHDDPDDCPCRKPKPGLFLDPPTYDVSQSFLIGDRWRDIEAGYRAGCHATILIDYDYGEPFPHEPDVRVGSLAEAVDWLLASLPA